MISEKYISEYTITTAPCYPRGKTSGKIDSRRARKGTHKNNTRSKLNHVTTFKNTPQVFKKDMIDTSTTHIGSDYIAHTYPKKIQSHRDQYHTKLPVKPLEKSLGTEI